MTSNFSSHVRWHARGRCWGESTLGSLLKICSRAMALPAFPMHQAQLLSGAHTYGYPCGVVMNQEYFWHRLWDCAISRIISEGLDEELDFPP